MKLTEEILESVRSYYKDQKLEIPRTIKEYNKNFKPGFGRTRLKELYGVTGKEFMALLNKDPSLYKTITYYTELFTEKLNITVTKVNSKYSDLKSYRLTFVCNDCSFEQEASISSLCQRTYGCTRCKSGNAKIKDNPELLLRRLANNNLSLVSSLPNNQLDKLKVICNNCYSTFEVLPVKIMHPQTDNTGTCPNCRTTDRRVVYDNKIFGSQLERNIYKELIKYFDNIECQKPYKHINKCSRNWSCDFYINNTIIEVSNFKADFKNYYGNLAEKLQWAKNSNVNFIHISKISEVKELIKDIV